MSAGVVIVGGSLAGLHTAEALRSEGWTGSVTVIDAHAAPFHDRPPLSKDYLSGVVEAERLMLREQEKLHGLDITWKLGHTATSVDRERQVVVLDDGEEVPYADLVVTTGVSPIVPAFMNVPATRTLRTIEDADRLRASLKAETALIVIGAGFIGLEAAATFRKVGARVDVVEALPTPLFRQVGPVVGEALRAVHEEHGVTFHLNRRAESVQQVGDRVEVTLDDGVTLVGDVLLVAVGSVPGTAWLEGSGLTLDNGLVTDGRLRAAPHVYGAGDVVRWPHPLVDRTVRIEHWSNAIEQGKYVAKEIAGTSDGAPFDGLPYFWSDQYDRKIQAHGFVDGAADLELIDGDFSGQKFAAVYLVDGRAVAAVGVNNPRQVIAGRKRVLADLAKQEVHS
jgi:NADPH-dependent 2,4-dienoyl-CoA reductase/sulfur reductase-like enzyme